MPTVVSELEVIGTRIENRGGVLQFEMATAIRNFQLLPFHAQRDPDNVPDPCNFMQARLERNSDRTANDVKASILNQDWQNLEYGAIIATSGNGATYHGPITPGAKDVWTPEATNFAGIAWDQIVGMLHNHPPNTPQGDGRKPSPGDWLSFGFLYSGVGARHGPVAANRLRMYILGNDGVLREYHWAQQESGELGRPVDPGEAGC